MTLLLFLLQGAFQPRPGPERGCPDPAELMDNRWEPRHALRAPGLASLHMTQAQLQRQNEPRPQLLCHGALDAIA